MAKDFNYYDFITGSHTLYERYIDDWKLAVKSYYGGVEYRLGNYLKAYDIDYTTQSDVVNTYDLDANGVAINKFRSTIQPVNTRQEADNGTQYNSNFYQEKINNVPVLPYTRLYVSEYNAILFRAAPVRTLPETPEVQSFIKDVDGEGNSINEFMSMVDTYTTVFGVVWVSCIKPAGADYARWRMHTPIDVTNWNYGYNASGDLELTKIVIRTATEPDVEIYQYITKDTIETVFVPYEQDSAVDLPVGAEAIEGDDGKTIYRISQVNELGYIPVRPVYQSTKIYNGVGHTPIFDIAQLQRSIYGDFGEIYSAVSYGAHPVNIIDETTLAQNNYNVGAEPGTTIRVQSSLNGQPSYVYEFVAPPLDSISELRELVEQKIEKMNQVAMIRSDELIKASRSGAQIEMYDSKLEAFIRKKATSLENVEAHNLWPMWFDWQGLPIPQDLTVSYNRLYSNRGLQQEIAEVTSIMNLVSEFETRFVKPEMEEPEEEESEEYGELEGGVCPVATQDVAVNLANRQDAIDSAAYGPLNPSQPNTEFWQRLADKWGVSVEEAKASRCGNCAAFIQTSKMLQCIDQGLAAGGESGSEWDTISAGDLGYCEAFDFKCASARTCDAWISGGPITDANGSDMEMEEPEDEMEESEDSEDSDEKFLDEMKEKIKARMKQLIDSSFSENSL
nr:MAG TPA: portal [Caudoviricetes sp.]